MKKCTISQGGIENLHHEMAYMIVNILPTMYLLLTAEIIVISGPEILDIYHDNRLQDESCRNLSMQTFFIEEIINAITFYEHLMPHHIQNGYPAPHEPAFFKLGLQYRMMR